MNLRRMCSLNFILGSLFASGLCADVLVSNLSEPLNPNGPTIIGNTPFGPDMQVWAAQSFLTAGTDWNLTSIDIIGGNATAAALPAFAQLRLDTGANEIDLTAGGLVANLLVPDLTGPTAIRNFALALSEQLQANTKYWFVTGVGLPDTETFAWDYANTGSFSGPGSLSDFAFSEDFGTTWSYLNQPFFPWSLQVNGSAVAVPEANAVLIILAGLIGSAGLQRRQRASCLTLARSAKERREFPQKSPIQ